MKLQNAGTGHCSGTSWVKIMFYSSPGVQFIRSSTLFSCKACQCWAAGHCRQAGCNSSVEELDNDILGSFMIWSYPQSRRRYKIRLSSVQLDPQRSVKFYCCSNSKFQVCHDSVVGNQAAI